MLKNFVHVMDVLHFGMDRAFRTDLAAETAGDAKSFFDSHFHLSIFFKRCRPGRGSVPAPRAEAGRFASETKMLKANAMKVL